MKKSILHLATTAAMVGGLAFAVSGSVVAGIADTKHNLGSSQSVGTNAQHSGTAEICVFCHTPHGSATGASVPLWNKTLPSVGSYTTYDTLGTSSLDGNVASVGSVSLACLSCHDGSQAMDTMLNAPGSGNTALGTSGWSNSGTGGIIAGTAESFPNLGVNLTNDHPVGIEYAGGGCGAGAACSVSTSANDKDFKDAAWKTINGKDVWWVDVASGATLSGTVTIVGNAGTREKTDMQLYTRNSGPYVECASCHDPHVENDTFLRVENDSSTVCLSCHVK
ncbi:MAG: cytochrome c3 family protein [Motiliproteus sp.]